MFSIYSSAFNLIKNQFDYEGAIKNFCSFADEVVIAVNTSVDCTFERLVQLQKAYDNLVLIETSFSYQNPAFDGLIKNAALQHTTEPLKIGLDMDERISLDNKSAWVEYANYLSDSIHGKALFIPVIDLFRDHAHYKSIGQKWYLHTKGLKRGVVNFAKKENGKIDIEKSDTCELLNQDDSLVLSLGMPIPRSKSYLDFIKKNSIPYVVHIGYLDTNRRVNVINPFWKTHWENRAGHEVTNIALKESDLVKEPYLEHGLRFSF